MAQRKLLQEVEKCFKKVAEGVAEFESIYEKIEQSTNPAQKDKLEDNLKREIKKLQRLRDQIKTWAASNDIKDKGPLLEQRRLIETQMEKFKAVEKAMKTKAYSKEGLSAAAKLDPKEKAKVEASDFLSQMVDDLEQQIETLEAESEQIQATMKKGKGQAAKAERVSNIEAAIERHKWHQSRLELMRRSLENGRLEPAQIRDLDEGIRYYVSENANDDFMEDDGLYDELGLDEDEEAYGLAQDKDNVSSQDTQSIQEDAFEPENGVSKAKPRTGAESAARRPSAQLKSPLPTLATLAAPLPTISSNSTATATMKPATIPARPAEGLKYASAAAAAAASDKIGIAPLPPPPGAAPVSAPGISPLPQAASAVQARSSSASSPIPVSPQPATVSPHLSETLPATSQPTVLPSHHKFNLGVGYSATSSAVPPTLTSQAFPSKSIRGKAPAPPEPLDPVRLSKLNGLSNGFTATEKGRDEDESIESIYHLPESLRDLVGGYEMSAKRQVSPLSQASLRMLALSQEAVPESSELEPRSTYHPEVRYVTLSNFPTEPLAILDSPSLYGRIDPDTLFYVFYYKQGTYQQYLAAKALKDQSWRFHKQYQTWFQRHEEPKAITEEFEQGTYRFFDYESTWMNRRKADFKFHYKYLEDDV